jgi:hypothetical protein
MAGVVDDPVGASPAREELPDTTGIQTTRVIVDIHREQALLPQTNAFQLWEQCLLAMNAQATTGIQTARVIVNAHREQARSYNDLCCTKTMFLPQTIVASEFTRAGLRSGPNIMRSGLCRHTALNGLTTAAQPSGSKLPRY